MTIQLRGCTLLRFPLLLFSSSHGRISSIFLVLLLLSPAIRAQSSGSGSNDPANSYYNAKFSPAMGVVIIVLIAALFFMGFFSIYLRRCFQDESSTGRNILMTGLSVRSRRAPRGLDAALLETFPTFAYSDVKSLKIGKGALECAVCLNEFGDEETLRLIPLCDHVFHTDCIDAWLIAHTTCPVCRANLVPQPSESTQDESPELGLINEHSPSQHDAVLEVAQECVPDADLDNMERPLHAPETVDVGQRLNWSRTRRNMSGRPRWFGRFSRSNSTGHVAVKQWENMDRFTLRLPEGVRRQIMSGKLQRSTSMVILPRQGSSRRGYRGGYGEGSSRGGRFSSARFDRPGGRSDRWGFSLAPPFFTRTTSMISPEVAASGGTALRDSSSRGTFAEGVNTVKVDDAAVNDAPLSARPPV